jgi:hypothetical protein
MGPGKYHTEVLVERTDFALSACIQSSIIIIHESDYTQRKRLPISFLLA